MASCPQRPLRASWTVARRCGYSPAVLTRVQRVRPTSDGALKKNRSTHPCRALTSQSPRARAPRSRRSPARSRPEGGLDAPGRDGIPVAIDPGDLLGQVIVDTEAGATAFTTTTASPLVVSIAAAGAASCSRDPEIAKRAQVAAGDKYFAEGKFAEAVVSYRAALQLDPRFGEARYKLADAYVKQDDYGRAVGEYVRAADLMPERDDAQIKAGNMLLLTGQFEDARTRALRENQKQVEEVESRIDTIKKRQQRSEKDLELYQSSGKGTPPPRLKEEITNAQIDLKAQQTLLDEILDQRRQHRPVGLQTVRPGVGPEYFRHFLEIRL